MDAFHSTNYCVVTESSDELSFKEGDLIMLKSWVGKEWLRGKLVNGQEGIFPKNYVEIVVSVVACGTLAVHVCTCILYDVYRRNCQLMQ